MITGYNICIIVYDYDICILYIYLCIYDSKDKSDCFDTIMMMVNYLATSTECPDD